MIKLTVAVHSRAFDTAIEVFYESVECRLIIYGELDRCNIVDGAGCSCI